MIKSIDNTQHSFNTSNIVVTIVVIPSAILSLSGIILALGVIKSLAFITPIIGVSIALIFGIIAITCLCIYACLNGLDPVNSELNSTTGTALKTKKKRVIYFESDYTNLWERFMGEAGVNGEWLGLRGTYPFEDQRGWSFSKELDFICSETGNINRSVSPVGYLESFCQLPGFLVRINEENIAKCKDPETNEAIPCIFTQVSTGFGGRKFTTSSTGEPCLDLRFNEGHLRFKSILAFKNKRDEQTQLFNLNEHHKSHKDRNWRRRHYGGDEIILKKISPEMICGIFYQKSVENDRIGITGAIEIQEKFFQRTSVVLPIFEYDIDCITKTAYCFEAVMAQVI